MATKITIPVDAQLVTVCIETYRVESKEIRVGRSTRIQKQRVKGVREIPPGEDAASVRQALAAANKIMAQADIAFTARSINSRRVLIPGNTDKVNEAGFVFLAKKFPARAGVILLVVKEFEGKELGGQAVEALRACIVKSQSSTGLGKVLAHELGHLLSLEHPDAKTDAKDVRTRYNLMYRALRAGDTLTTEQIKKARESKLVRKVAATKSP